MTSDSTHSSAPAIVVKRLTKAFITERATARYLFEGFDYCQRAGEFVSIVGANGSGKSTLIRMLAGLETSDDGRVEVNGVLPGSWNARCGVIFQDYGLFPWKTARQNVAFGLKAHKMGHLRRESAVDEYLWRLQIKEHEHKYPHELSGGLRQRTAIARTLAIEPSILLMDEPFAAIDVAVRRQLQELVLELWDRNKWTILMVTHDAEEATFMSDRVVIFGGVPTCVKKEVRIDLPRPRPSTVRFSSEFRTYYEEITSQINL